MVSGPVVSFEQSWAGCMLHVTVPYLYTRPAGGWVAPAADLPGLGPEAAV
jgi:hypothetical protein